MSSIKLLNNPNKPFNSQYAGETEFAFNGRPTSGRRLVGFGDDIYRDTPAMSLTADGGIAASRIRFSPNGKFVAVGYMSGASPILIYAIQPDGRWRHNTVSGLPSNFTSVYGMDWSPDSEFLYISEQNTARVARIRVTPTLMTAVGFTESVATTNAWTTSISPCGDFLLRGTSTAPFLKLYKTNNLAIPADYGMYDTGSPQPTADGGVISAAWSPDSRMFVIAQFAAPYLKFYSWQNQSVFALLPTPADLPTGNVRCVRFSPCGQYLLVVTEAQPNARVYRITGNTVTLIQSAISDGAATLCLDGAWSPDSTGFVVCHWGSPFFTAFRFNGKTITKLAKSDTSLPGANPRSIDISPTGNQIGIASESSPYVSVFQILKGGAREGTIIQPGKPSNMPIF